MCFAKGTAFVHVCRQRLLCVCVSPTGKRNKNTKEPSQRLFGPLSIYIYTYMFNLFDGIRSKAQASTRIIVLTHCTLIVCLLVSYAAEMGQAHAMGPPGPVSAGPGPKGLHRTGPSPVGSCVPWVAHGMGLAPVMAIKINKQSVGNLQQVM